METRHGHLQTAASAFRYAQFQTLAELWHARPELLAEATEGHASIDQVVAAYAAVVQANPNEFNVDQLVMAVELTTARHYGAWLARDAGRHLDAILRGVELHTML